jgi:hypothetical protein
LLLATVLQSWWAAWNGLLAKVLGIWWPTRDGDSSKKLKNKQKENYWLRITSKNHLYGCHTKWNL